MIGIWVDVTGYLDVFIAPEETDAATEIAHYACYVGRILAGISFMVFPQQFLAMKNKPIYICLIMLVGTILYSFAYYQQLFSPTAVAMLGSALIGYAHIWVTAVAYLLLLSSTVWKTTLIVIILGQLAERMFIVILDIVLPDSLLIVLTYALPILVAALLVLAQKARVKNAGEQTSLVSGNARRYFWVLMAVVGIGMVVCGAMSNVGLWGEGGIAYKTSDPLVDIFESLMQCVIVVILSFLTFYTTREKPLGLRYQSSLLVLITSYILVLTQQLLSGTSNQILDVLLVSIENYAHVLIWVVILDARRSLETSPYRVLGFGLISCSTAALLWIALIERHLLGTEAIVLGVFYVFLIISFLYPQLSHRENVSGKVRDSSLNQYVLDGESRIGSGVNGVAMTEAVEDRCKYLAQEFKLSARENDVLTLLVQGRTRQEIYKRLVISEGTVKTHIAHIFAKMDIHSIQELLDIVYSSDSGKA